MTDDSCSGNTTKVLVLDEGFVSGALTALGLRRAGCEVHVAAAVGGTGWCESDGITWRCVPTPRDPRLVAALDRLVREGRFDVVYPLTEPLQALLQDMCPAWSTLVFPVVAEAQRPARRDKRLMSDAVAAAAVAVPRRYPAMSDPDLRGAIREMGLPIVVKGTEGRGGNTTTIAGTADAAARAVARIRARGGVAFAEAFIPGPTFLTGGLFENGEALRFYAAEKTVQFPSRTGPAVQLVASGDPTLIEDARRAFAASGVTGIASADFVRAPDGEFLFLELNARPWGSIGAAGDAGVDLFSPLVELWRGGTVTPDLDFKVGVRSSVFPLCLLSLPYLRSTGAFTDTARDCARMLSLARRDPARAAMLMLRLCRVAQNW